MDSSDWWCRVCVSDDKLWGYNNKSWDVNDFFPAIYVKTYIDEIFDAAGYSYTSTFFSSSYFKHLIVPFAGDKLTISAAQVNARLFSAKTSLVTTVYLIALSYLYNTTPLFTQNLIFDNEISDPSNQYNPATGVFTVANTGFYQFNISGLLSAVATTGGAFTGSRTSITHNIYLIRNNNASTFGVATVTTTIDTTVAPFGVYVIGTPLFTNVAIAGSSLSFAANAGDVITFKYTATNNGLYSTHQEVPVFSFSFNSLGTITNSITNPTIVDGFPLTINSTLPIDIKQSDFLMSIIRMFNCLLKLTRTIPTI
jgi:hypothetical protein